MSQAAANAMRILAEEMERARDDMPPGQGHAMMTAQAKAHRATADRLEAAAKGLAAKLGHIPERAR